MTSWQIPLKEYYTAYCKAFCNSLNHDKEANVTPKKDLKICDNPVPHAWPTKKRVLCSAGP